MPDRGNFKGRDEEISHLSWNLRKIPKPGPLREGLDEIRLQEPPSFPHFCKKRVQELKLHVFQRPSGILDREERLNTTRTIGQEAEGPRRGNRSEGGVS